MSDVRGSISRGKKKDLMKAVEIQGKLTPEQWAELIEALRMIAKKYQLTVRDVKK
jgi:hypothetical protein